MKSKAIKAKSFFILLLFLLFGSFSVPGQNVVHFKILSSVDGLPISYAMIENRTENSRFLSDEMGAMDMAIQDSTLLRISALSYQDHFVLYQSAMNEKEIEIRLLPRVYELEEFVLNPYHTIALFKKALLGLQIEDSNAISAQLFILESLKPYELQPEDFQGQDVLTLGLGSPISALYNLTSKRAKSQRKYQKLMHSDYNVSMMQQKYNKQIVMKLTALEEGEVLDKFMEYCEPSLEFILRSSEYDVALLILQRYDTFLLNPTD